MSVFVNKTSSFDSLHYHIDHLKISVRFQSHENEICFLSLTLFDIYFWEASLSFHDISFVESETWDQIILIICQSQLGNCCVGVFAWCIKTAKQVVNKAKSQTKFATWQPMCEATWPMWVGLWDGLVFCWIIRSDVILICICQPISCLGLITVPQFDLFVNKFIKTIPDFRTLICSSKRFRLQNDSSVPTSSDGSACLETKGESGLVIWLICK